jgi:hypothetical protein
METTETSADPAEEEQPGPYVKAETPRERVLRKYDFVNSKRMNNSLAVVEEKYPDGAPEHVMATLLAITVEEVEQEDKAITDKFRRLMKV